jgi:PAS domain S-box-containing protein
MQPKIKKNRKAGRARSKPAESSKKPPTNQRFEEHQLEEHQRSQSILFSEDVATWTWDVAEDRVVADENLARLFGVAPTAAGGGPIGEYVRAIHPQDRPRVDAAIAAALEGPKDSYSVDYRILRKDGSVSWVSARGRVERDRQGKPKYFPGIVLDITDRKLSEEKADELRFRLEQQYRLFDITLSSISDFAYIFDRKFRFVYVNQALLDLWGLRLEEAVGKDFHDLKYPYELAERLHRQIQQVFDTKEGLRDETPYTSPTGAGGYYEYIFRPVFDRDGNVEVVAGSTRDITSRKQVEEALKQSQESLRLATETLEKQVAERTGELEKRNQQVLKQAEQLRKLSVSLMTTQDQERRHIARELHDSAGQVIAALSINLDTMVRDLAGSDPAVAKLAVQTRSYADELSREIRTTSYLLHPPLLDEVGLRPALIWYAEGLKARADIDVTVNISTEFQRLPRDMEITIFRVVQECLTNIHRHSGSKSAQITVAREETTVVVEIRDAGCGIAADKLARIREQDTGLGLRGIRERVHQSGGQLVIESQAGAGTTIRVSLPFAEGDVRTSLSA